MKPERMLFWRWSRVSITPISQMDEQLAIEVAELAAMIGGELARREIDQDPALLADHVLQIARALPVQQHPPGRLSSSFRQSIGQRIHRRFRVCTPG